MFVSIGYKELHSAERTRRKVATSLPILSKERLAKISCVSALRHRTGYGERERD